MENENYYELSEDTINDFMEIYDKKSFPTKIEFKFLGSKKEKNLVKITKLADQYAYLLGNKDILVTINEELIDVYDEESVSILIEQELEKIRVNLDSGKIKFDKTDVNTFSSLINKYGVEKVSRANKVEELYQSQKDDSDKNDDFIV